VLCNIHDELTSRADLPALAQQLLAWNSLSPRPGIASYSDSAR
jgi:hypothetical protein